MRLSSLILRSGSALVLFIVLLLGFESDARSDGGDDSKEPVPADHDSADVADPTTTDATDAPRGGDATAAAKATKKLAAEDRTPVVEDHTVKTASTEIASYTDTDHISVFTPTVAAGIENATSGASFHGSYLIDVVSAASVDIVSTASRRWFELRQAGAVDFNYKPHTFGGGIAANVSSEPDYLSYGASGNISQDFYDKNLTLQLGYGYGHDTIGRGGTPFAIFSRTLQRNALSAGLTAVINRSTVAGYAFDLMLEDGDSSKPYRFIPMFSSKEAANVPQGASIQYVTEHRLPERPLEQLPLARQRFAFTWRIAHRFDTSTIRFEERVYDDTWALKASSTDARWIFDVGKRFQIGPHVRFHAQSGVSFWERAYAAGSGASFNLPEFRTGDRENGPLWTLSGGGTAKYFLGSSKDPHAWAVGLTTDLMYTSFLDDLYLTDRTAVLGAFTLEAEL